MEFRLMRDALWVHAKRIYLQSQMYSLLYGKLKA